MMMIVMIKRSSWLRFAESRGPRKGRGEHWREQADPGEGQGGSRKGQSRARKGRAERWGLKHRQAGETFGFVGQRREVDETFGFAEVALQHDVVVRAG
jgi:hypothetical protein